MQYKEYEKAFNALSKDNKHTVDATTILKPGYFVLIKYAGSSVPTVGFLKTVNRVNVIVYTTYMDKEMLEITFKKADVTEYIIPTN